MARKKKAEPPAKSGAWLTTFNDLMTLLLTFFVLLLSMGSLEGGKISAAVSEFNSALGVLGSGSNKEYPIFHPIARVLLYGQKYKEVQHIYRSPDKEEINEDAHEITRPISRRGAEDGDLREPSGGADTPGGHGGGSGKVEKMSRGDGDMETAGQSKEKRKPGTVSQKRRDDASRKELSSAGQTETPIVSIAGVDYHVNGRRDITFKMPGEVLFDVGEADIRSAAYPMLDEIAAVIAKADKSQVVVTGHTDDTPIHTARFPSNWELSVVRAAEVLRYLADKSGAGPERLMSSGYGSSRPVASNDSPEGRRLNRRVEIKLITKR